MYQSNQLTKRSQLVRNSINRSAWRRGLHLSALALVVAWLALSPQARAVCQEGCAPSENTFLGDDAFLNNTIGTSNTAIGAQALYDNISGNYNTAVGYDTLYNNDGGLNTAIGVFALSYNTIGTENTANGSYALYRNTTGYYNTANGGDALTHNTTGIDNTATGIGALGDNTTGSFNTANGGFALSANTTASGNTADGFNALYYNTTGYRNTAIGANALFNNLSGRGNTAIGFQALYQNIGSNNVALGFNAGVNLTTGSGNVCIGYNVLGVAGENNTTRISNIYASVASGRAVYVNSDNKIGTLVSSRRFKDEIKPMDKASEAILALEPVTFHYKKEIEPNGAIMFGLIAEDVEKVDPDLVTRNDKGEAETVRYEAVNAMLLNEFLKEHRKGEQQERKIEQLKAVVAKLQLALKEQAEQIEAVSAALQASKPSPRLVANNP